MKAPPVLVGLFLFLGVFITGKYSALTDANQRNPNLPPLSKSLGLVSKILSLAFQYAFLRINCLSLR